MLPVDVSVDKLMLLTDVGGMRALKKFMHDSDDTHAWLFTSLSSIDLICVNETLIGTPAAELRTYFFLLVVQRRPHQVVLLLQVVASTLEARRQSHALRHAFLHQRRVDLALHPLQLVLVLVHQRQLLHLRLPRMLQLPHHLAGLLLHQLFELLHLTLLRLLQQILGQREHRLVVLLQHVAVVGSVVAANVRQPIVGLVAAQR